MDSKNIIETQTLRLSIMKKSDYESVYPLMNTKEVLDTMVLDYPVDPHEFYRNCCQSPFLAEEGKNYNFIIRLRDGGDVAGMCVLLDVNPERNKAELGYWIAPSLRRKGIAFEACIHLLRYAYSVKGFRKIWAETFYFNIPSQRLLEKIGFTKIGIKKQEVKKHGKWQDRILYELLSEDFHFSNI